MGAFKFSFCDVDLQALPSGILWWGDRRLLCVSDLHLGKSDRVARASGPLLPPYDTRDTLARLSEAIFALDPLTVVCLGDSFDDLRALDGLDPADHKTLTAMMARRRWIWIEGNHDPGPLDIGGSHMLEYELGGLTFRHQAKRTARGEVSGHFHPKARVTHAKGTTTRPCFLMDENRIVMPAFGAYTGGLRTTDPALTHLMSEDTLAILTGNSAIAVPMPRG